MQGNSDDKLYTINFFFSLGMEKSFKVGPGRLTPPYFFTSSISEDILRVWIDAWSVLH